MPIGSQAAPRGSQAATPKGSQETARNVCGRWSTTEGAKNAVHKRDQKNINNMLLKPKIPPNMDPGDRQKQTWTPETARNVC